MNEIHHAAPPPEPRRGFSGAQVALIVLVSILATAALAFFVLRTYLFPSQFEPVALTEREQAVLEQKLERLDASAASEASRQGRRDDNDMTPEPYREDDQARTVIFTERELNGLIGRDPQLAERVAIDLAEDLISAKLLVPIDQDFPVMGGRILRIRTGLVFDYADQRPVVKLKGVTLMGVPLPNAWLGGLKNVDLVAEFGTEEGFWQLFAEGVADIEVREGQLRVRLNE